MYYLSNAQASDFDVPHPPDKNYYPFQKAGVEYLVENLKLGRNSLLADDMGLGKAQDLDSKILTPFGWKRMGDIVVGYEIINSKGGISKVVGVFPQGIQDMFKVTFSDGSSTLCTDDHLWKIQTPNHRVRGYVFKLKSLKEFKDDLHDSYNNRKWFIPIIQCVNYAKKDVPIDPYLMGVLIGDGSLGGRICISCNDEDIIGQCSLPSGYYFYKHIPKKGCPSYRISSSNGNTGTYETYNRKCPYCGFEERSKSKKGTKMWKLRSGTKRKVMRWDCIKCGKTYSDKVFKNEFKEKIKELGLSGKCSDSKFIPEIYLMNDEYTRIRLLQGLMDTDGYVDKDGTVSQYHTTSKRLSDDFCFLVRSLGGIVSVHVKKETTYRYKGEKKKGLPCYVHTLKLPSWVTPFSLSRKLSRFKPKSKYPPSRSFEYVEYVGKREAQCIKTDSDDGLYITDDFIVTHNTSQAIGLINQLVLKKVLIICPSSLMLNWRQEMLGNEKLPGWLIQYDIRKAMGFPPMTDDEVRDALVRLGFKKPTPTLMEEFKKSMKQGWRVHISRYNSRVFFDPDANINIINYDVLTKAENELKDYPFDLIICDESHQAKNPKAARTKAVWNICSGKRLVLITGTPILSRPEELWSLLYILDPKYWGPFNGDNYWWFMRTFTGARKVWNEYARAEIWDTSGATNLDELQVILRKRHMVRRLKADVLTQLPPKTRQLMVIDPNTREMKDALDAEKKLMEEQGLSIDEIADAIGDDALEIGVKKLHKDKVFHSFGNVRLQIAMAKLPIVLDFTDEILENTNKVVMFAWHRDVVDAIEKHYGPRCVKFYGGMSIDEKKEAENRFMSDPDVNVFIGNIQSAGVGLTLTASHTVVFVEMDWVPAMMQQAEDRLHRITQKDNVLVYYTIVDGSMDASIASTLVRKLGIIEKAVNITEATPTIEDVVKKEEAGLREMERHAEIERRDAMMAKRLGEIDAYIDKKGGPDAFPSDVLEGVRTYTPEKEIALLDAMKYIYDNKLATSWDIKYVSSFTPLRYLSGGQYITAWKIARHYPIPDELKKIIYGGFV